MDKKKFGEKLKKEVDKNKPSKPILKPNNNDEERERERTRGFDRKSLYPINHMVEKVNSKHTEQKKVNLTEMTNTAMGNQSKSKTNSFQQKLQQQEKKDKPNKNVITRRQDRGRGR